MKLSSTIENRSLIERKQPLRILALLDSLARASISPAPLRVVHEMAYLANVLAPVFDLQPYSASLLKRRAGPYYPSLQKTLDELVGCGMVIASDLRYLLIPEEGRYRIEAKYKLNRELAGHATEHFRKVYGDTSEVMFLDELATAYSTLTDMQFGSAALEDARYIDDNVDANNIIDFGEWESQANANFSCNAALSFAPMTHLQPAERLYLYIDHIRQRATNDR
jgi:hypothetical protein